MAQHQFTKQYPEQPGPKNDLKTIWVGDLLPWMTESYMCSVFRSVGSITNIKFFRDKTRGQQRSYVFIEFDSSTVVDGLLRNFPDGYFAAEDGNQFRFKKAQFDVSHGGNNGSYVDVYVGNLDHQVTEVQIFHHFAKKYPSTQMVRIPTDNTGMMKGYAFVSFKDKNEAERAISEMTGTCLRGRPIKVRHASRNMPTQPEVYTWEGQLERASELGGHRVMITGLDHNITEFQFAQYIGQFGPTLNVRVLPGQAFASFCNKQDAEKAVDQLNGCNVGGLSIHAKLVQPSDDPYPAPRVPNLVTTSNATVEEAEQKLQSQLQQMGWQIVPAHLATGLSEHMSPTVIHLPSGGLALQPGFEHFQVLLQDPEFVMAFQQQLRGDIWTPSCEQRMSMLSCDGLDHHGRCPTIAQHNWAFMPGYGTPMALGHGLLPS